MSNIIIAHFAENSHAAQTEPLFQYDYGQLLKFEGLELPASYEVHFSNSRAGGKAYRLINEGDTVEIPDGMLLDGRTVYVWIFLHSGETDGETEYIVTIPVIDRSEPYDGEPTPHQKTYIDQMVERMEEISAEVNDISAEAVTLEPGTEAYADYTDGHIMIGVPRGPQGEQGIQGIQGIQGPQGIKGDKGDTGETGATGPQGPIGPRGEPGPRGDAFHIVKTYPSIAEMNADYGGTDVDIGEFVMIVSNVEDPDNAKVYVKGDVLYNFIVDMSGSAGIQGPKGDKGDKGDTGETGATGPQGIKGDKGDTGETGAKGDKGDKGDTGETGATGPQGPKGDKGDTGIGIASGGTAGQVLAKASGTDYDTEWVDQSIGNVTDVQINGSSILDAQGVANVPIAGTDLGVVKKNLTYGIDIPNSGQISLIVPTSNEIKNGYGGTRRAIMTYNQHEATFYGLAKAAGADMKSIASTTVGQYPEAQKSAISQMLNGSVTVTGTTPSITALPGIRYVCGEVATLDITLPASGIVDVVFESGATATVLTITPPSGVTLKWANGFDPTALEANTTYEINIADGLGVAASWT